MNKSTTTYFSLKFSNVLSSGLMRSQRHWVDPKTNILV